MVLISPGTDYLPNPAGLYVPPEYAVPEKRPIGLDLFCGIGGMSLGFMQAGYEIICGVDNEPYAALTYMQNLGSFPITTHYVSDKDADRLEKACGKNMVQKEKSGAWKMTAVSGSGYMRHSDFPPVRNFIFGDLRDVSGTQICEWLDIEVGELDCVMGGPPCQGFSTVGRRNVMDPRNSLVFEFCRLVVELRPKTMLFENVPGIVSMVTQEGLPVIDAMCRILEDGSYGGFEALKRGLLESSGSGAALRSKNGAKPKKKKKAKKAAVVQQEKLL